MKNENPAEALVSVFLWMLIALTVVAIVWSIMDGPMYFAIMALLVGGFWFMLFMVTEPANGWRKLKPLAFFVVWVLACYVLLCKFDVNGMNQYLLGYRDCTVFVTNSRGECVDIKYGDLKVKGQRLYYVGGGYKEYPEGYTVRVAKSE